MSDSELMVKKKVSKIVTRNYHSYEQLIRFIQSDPDCIKSIGVVCSIFIQHKDSPDNKKALELCHHVAIKLARIYNKKVTRLKTYSQVVTPAVITRIKYFVYETSLDTVKEC